MVGLFDDAIMFGIDEIQDCEHKAWIHVLNWMFEVGYVQDLALDRPTWGIWLTRL